MVVQNHHLLELALLSIWTSFTNAYFRCAWKQSIGTFAPNSGGPGDSLICDGPSFFGGLLKGGALSMTDSVTTVDLTATGAAELR